MIEERHLIAICICLYLRKAIKRCCTRNQINAAVANTFDNQVTYSRATVIFCADIDEVPVVIKMKEAMKIIFNSELPFNMDIS